MKQKPAPRARCPRAPADRASTSRRPASIRVAPRVGVARSSIAGHHHRDGDAHLDEADVARAWRCARGLLALDRPCPARTLPVRLRVIVRPRGSDVLRQIPGVSDADVRRAAHVLMDRTEVGRGASHVDPSAGELSVTTVRPIATAEDGSSRDHQPDPPDRPAPTCPHDPHDLSSGATP